jgi:hypothetical protein
MKQLLPDLELTDWKNLPNYRLLPPILRKDNDVPLKNLGFYFKPFLEQYFEDIDKIMDDENNIVVTQSYQGRPVRSKLKDMSMFQNVIHYFEHFFQRKSFDVYLNRLYPTDVPRILNADQIKSGKDYWISEMWHTDNKEDGAIKLNVYLSDVDDDSNSPFEYIKNPEKHFYLYKKFQGDDKVKLTRVNNFNPRPDQTIKVYGKKYTSILFIPNFIHKGNFAKTKVRDLLSLKFVP